MKYQPKIIARLNKALKRLKVKNKSLRVPKEAQMGYDMGNRADGHTTQPTGVPHKPEHRKFMNM